MIRPSPVLALVCLLAATGVHAGAWPRGAGKGFAAVTARIADGTLTSEPPWRGSLYLDYGISARGGLALEIDGAPGRLDKALTFHSLSLLPRDHPRKLSFAIGVGVIDGTAALSPRLTSGRAVTLFGVPGWAEAAISAEFTRTGQAGKLDLTFGLSPTPRMRAYVQLFVHRGRGGGTSLRAETSVAYRLSGRLWIDAGVSSGITPETDHRLKLGIWTAF